ncbi:CHAT domain-containing protein [Aquimarina litoralis]|uniref:CHAT domain-containing protein n=1 Tax=Aquimarina litoralis TaxID=584605 RepID=UPI001C581DDA|nr:CHAT domain-containing protein [Aquimarina litoralis]MBW1299059.1 CHAT domain-containing protein [Aquimarina litoralis]
MVLNPTFIITTYFLLFLSVSLAASTNDNDFFKEQYQKINQNIRQGYYKDNLQLIKQLEKEARYQELDCYQKGKIWHKIGVSYYKLNREKEAITYYKDKVLNSWEDCPQVPASEKANTIYNIGVSYQYLNNMEAAKKYIDQALNIFENDTNYPSEKLARKYHGIGRFYKELNDAFRAELYYQNAINLYRKQGGNKFKEFDALNNLIAMNNNFRAYNKSKKYIKEALSIYNSFPEAIPQLNLAMVYLNAGSTYFELKEYQSAKEMAKRSLLILNEETEPFYYSIALEIIAMIHADERNFNAAEKDMGRVLEIRKKLYSEDGNQKQMGRVYENLSDILIRKGDIAKADDYISKEFKMLVPVGSFDQDNLPIIRISKALDDAHLIRLIELKIRAFEAQYKASKDVQFLKKALSTQHKIDSVINRSLVSFQFEQSKLDFLNLKFKHYGKAIEDALQLYEITNNTYYLEEAYYFSSKTKAIVLQYELNQVDAFKSNVSKEVLQKEKTLREEMHTQQALLMEAIDNQDSLLNTYTKAQYELDKYLKEIEQKEPDYFKEKYTFILPPKLKEIREDLPKDMVVIEYFISDNTMYSFWLTNDDFFSISTPYDTVIKKALDDFIAQCHNPAFEVSEKLSKLIFERCLQQGLKKIDSNINRICIIPDGQLHKLSFEALTDPDETPKKYLIQDYSISYSYSISLLFRKQQNRTYNYIGFGTKYSENLNKKLKARKRFFGSENLTQLALSQEEIKRGAAIFDGKTFINDQASLENFISHSTDADIIHLSLHGLVDMDDPGRSSIIFDDQHQEFILSSQDLYGNRLKANLVLLSACHSASGKIYSGEGVQGMSKSFLLGGAHNILSSLWNATEASSLFITTSFLENIHSGQATDVALHQSKLDYLSKTEPNKKHPYYWANFILLGEVDKYQGSKSLSVWMILLGIIVLFFFLLRYSKSTRKV